jgi:MFS family permease
VVVASVSTGLLRWAGGDAPLVFVLAAAVVLLTVIGMRGALAEPWSSPPEEERTRLLQRFPGWLLVIGTLGALAFWIEGTWQDWAAVYLERDLSAPAAVSALGPAFFAAAMTAGRLSAHRIARPGGERTVLVAGAALAGAGSAVAAAAPWTVLALAGIVVAGAGCAVCAPTIVSLAGRAAGPHERATAIGSVTTLMYLGFLVGPAAVGGAAELGTLRSSLAGVGALGLLLAALFLAVRLPDAQR